MSDDEATSPDFEVWNHLESGWQMAHDDMARRLDPETMKFFGRIAAVIVGSTTAFHLDRDFGPVRAKLEEMFPGLDSAKYEVVLQASLEAYQTGPNPWLKHAVELELARDGIWRSTEAFGRFNQLAPQLNQRPLPARAEGYIREAIQTFVFGFDPACIALCRSALEQVAKDVLVRLGVYTVPYLEKTPIPLESLLSELKRAAALVKSSDAADRIRKRGNTVLHDHLYDQKIRRQTALDTIVDLANVLREVLP